MDFLKKYSLFEQHQSRQQQIKDTSLDSCQTMKNMFDDTKFLTKENWEMKIVEFTDNYFFLSAYNVSYYLQNFPLSLHKILKR